MLAGRLLPAVSAFPRCSSFAGFTAASCLAHVVPGPCVLLPAPIDTATKYSFPTLSLCSTRTPMLLRLLLLRSSVPLSKGPIWGGIRSVVALCRLGRSKEDSHTMKEKDGAEKVLLAESSLEHLDPALAPPSPQARPPAPCGRWLSPNSEFSLNLRAVPGEPQTRLWLCA